MVDMMLHDPRVRVVSFTGSTEVGRKAFCARRPTTSSSRRWSSAANAPLLVMEDAHIDTAVEGAMLAKMRNLGEACTAANRFYVHEAVAEPFTEKFTAAMARLRVGNGLEPDVDVGPLVNAATRDKVAAFVEDAVAKGAVLKLGGTIPNRPGFFLPADGPGQCAGERRLCA